MKPPGPRPDRPAVLYPRGRVYQAAALHCLAVRKVRPLQGHAREEAGGDTHQVRGAAGDATTQVKWKLDWISRYSVYFFTNICLARGSTNKTIRGVDEKNRIVVLSLATYISVYVSDDVVSVEIWHSVANEKLYGSLCCRRALNNTVQSNKLYRTFIEILFYQVSPWNCNVS